MWHPPPSWAVLPSQLFTEQQQVRQRAVAAVVEITFRTVLHFAALMVTTSPWSVSTPLLPAAIITFFQQPLPPRQQKATTTKRMFWQPGHRSEKLCPTDSILTRPESHQAETASSKYTVHALLHSSLYSGVRVGKKVFFNREKVHLLFRSLLLVSLAITYN